MLPAVTSLYTSTEACWPAWFVCNILKNGRKLKAAWLVGESDHAGHLTGRGGRLWRERWLNGSDVGRLRGKRKVGNIRTKGLVVQTHRSHFYSAGRSFMQHWLQHLLLGSMGSQAVLKTAVPLKSTWSQKWINCYHIKMSNFKKRKNKTKQCYNYYMETKPVLCLSVNMLISAVKLDILMLVSKSIWESRHARCWSL